MATKILTLDGLNDATLCALISQLLQTLPGVSYANIDFLSQRLTLEITGREAADVVKDVVLILEKNIPSVSIKNTKVGETLGRSRVPVPEVHFGRYEYGEKEEEEEVAPPPKKEEPKMQEFPTAQEEKAEETTDPNLKHFLQGILASSVVFGLSFFLGKWKLLFQICNLSLLLFSAVSTLCFQTGNLQGKVRVASWVQILVCVLLFFTGGESQAVAAMLIYELGLLGVFALYEQMEERVKTTLKLCDDGTLRERLSSEVRKLEAGSEAAKMRAVLQDGLTNETDTVWSTKKSVILVALVELVVLLLVTMWRSASGSLEGWFHPLLAFLLLTAPCGLTASVHGIQLAALCRALGKGIIIRTGSSLENICKVKTGILEFSGMLTKNEYHLVDIWVTEGKTADELLALAACVENGLTHPIARAILSEYYQRAGKEQKIPVIDMQEQAKGYGVRAMVKRKMILLGSEKFMRDAEIEVPPNPTELSCVYLSERGEYIGALLLEDPLRGKAEGLGSRLRSLGLERVGILTGHDGAVAMSAGTKIGVDVAYFEQDSKDKLATMNQLFQKTQQKKQLLYVGNTEDEDLFVLPCTRIAMGQEAFSRLFEFTDAVIPSADLGKLEETIAISKEAQKVATIHFNVYLSAKILFIGLAILGSLPVLAAAGANAVLTLLLALDALRIFEKNK